MRGTTSIRRHPLTRMSWLGLVFIAGCGGSDALNSPTAQRLRALANMYLNYAAARGGGPDSEQTFKKYVRSADRIVLDMNGIDPNAIDTLFVSERDQQPFVVNYGVAITRISGTSAPLVAYEKTGKNGMRLVAYANTKVEHVNEAKLQELISAKTAAPP
jgi:hypothetical protein